jgi:hypothetical protein
MAANSTMTTTHMDARIPEVWSSKVLGKLPSYLNLAKTVSRDFENEVAQHGDKVNVTKRGSFTASDKTEGNDVTLQQATDTTVQIVLSNHKEITFSPSDVARAFAKPKIMEGYIKDAVVTLAESVETSIAALYSGAGNTVNSGSALTLAKLREARRNLITEKVSPNEPIYGYIDEYAMEDLPLTDASVLGTNQPVVEGSVAKLGGVNLFESQNVQTSASDTVYHDLVYTEDAIALAVRPLPMDAEAFGGAKQGVVNDEQTGLSIRTTMSYNANALAPQVTVDILWGVKVMRSEHLVDLYHTNA